MIQTAEGALNETQDILQRMRELATQAANDTNTDSDRGEIQKEINQLTTEINRIGNTTEFNTQKILKGDGSAAEKVGALNLAGTGIVEQEALSGGKVVEATGANLQLSLNGTDGADELDGKEYTFKLNGESIKLNFNTVSSATDPAANSFEVKDGGKEVSLTLVTGADNQEFIMSKVQESLSAAMEANSNIDSSNYTISRDEAVLSIKSVAAGEGQAISIEGAGDYATSAAGLTASTDDGATFAALDTTALVDTGTAETRTRATSTIDNFTAANLKSQILESGVAVDNTNYFDGSGNVTDVGASKFLEGKGFSIGDETVEFYNSNEGEYEGTADHAVDLALVAWDSTTGSANFDVNDAEALVSSIVDQIGNKMESVTLSANSTASKLDVTAKEPGIKGNSIEIKDGASREASDIVGSEFQATFQIGANNGQSMTIEIGDMRADALGITGKAGNIQGAVDGAKFTSANNVTNGTDSEETTAALDVSTHESASASIEVINNAIEKVSSERSKLGAFQNRLDHTINNLGTSSENLTAAESRIRDVDYALAA